MPDSTPPADADVELKPCPFCGDAAHIVYDGPSAQQAANARSWGQDVDGGWYRGQCKSCGASVGEFRKKREVAPAWNRRPLTDNDKLREDAERWRALLSSERIRMMGSAGFKPIDGEWKPSRDDVHMGLELWSKHAAAHPSVEFPQDRCRAMLLAYVEHIRALKKEGSQS